MQIAMGTIVLASIFLVFSQFSLLVYAQSSNSTWLTLNGSAPLVIARGGFSGLFPYSSPDAFTFATVTSVPDIIFWCDVQLTKDGVGICLPDINLDNSTYINRVYPNKDKSYDVNGVKIRGYFPNDFTINDLQSVSLMQGIYTRSFRFDEFFPIQTVDNIFNQIQPHGFWLNIQYNEFYSKHNLSMMNFLTDITKTVNISHISSPEVNFLKSLVTPFARTTSTKLVFRFLDRDSVDPSINMTYGSLLRNLTFIKTFASAILVPKNYIWPVDSSLYLLDHTSLVEDAHNIGLQVFASDFANDNFDFAYNYSYNPVSEYLSFMDNGNFSVDGVLSDFPITASEARECFAHLGTVATDEVKTLIISHGGSSGDYPACTDVSYTKAITDGADVIDCPVQMSNDGVPFCLSSINLMNSTQVVQTKFRDLITTVAEIQPNPGIFSFSMKWTDIQALAPVISNPLAQRWSMYRNPRYKNAGKIISLSEFLELAKNTTSLSGILIKIENANYLASKEGLNITNAVTDALEKAGYNQPTAKKVMIQSTSSSILKDMKGKEYEFIYEVDEMISNVLNATILEIKDIASSVVINKDSVFPITLDGFLIRKNNIVSHLQSFKLAVYVQIFWNEFINLPFDFYADPIVDINTFIMGAGIDGLITDFPQTAAAYKRNKCLQMKTPPNYMSPVPAGELLKYINPNLMPPTEAPYPTLRPDDVSETTPPPPPPPPPSPTPPNGDVAKITTTNCLLTCLVCLLWLYLFNFDDQFIEILY